MMQDSQPSSTCVPASLDCSKEYLLEIIRRQDRELAVLAGLLADKTAAVNLTAVPEVPKPIVAQPEEIPTPLFQQEVRSRRFWRRS